MKDSATAVEVRRRPYGRRLTGVITACALTFGLTALAPAALASTVSVTGGGIDAGGLCAVAASCPASATFAYGSGGAITGTLDYNTSTLVADFSLSLSSPVYFGTGAGAPELTAGTFTASAVPVTATLSGGIETISLNALGLNASTSNLSFVNPALSVTENTPLLSALKCQISATSGQCGVTLGSVVGGASNSLELSDGVGNTYNTVLTFNMNVVPVPLPGSSWLLLSGMFGLGALGARRKPNTP